MSTKARAYILGDNISTDQIHPPNFFSLDTDVMKKGFLYGVSPEWAGTIEPGAIIIAGENFGCGSSRELTSQVFKERGIRLILAKSYARIFYRNIINFGVVACHLNEPCKWPEGSVVDVVFDPETKTISSGGYSVTYAEPSPFVNKIIKAGGLIPLIDDLFS